jgi:hypothetical protein
MTELEEIKYRLAKVEDLYNRAQGHIDKSKIRDLIREFVDNIGHSVYGEWVAKLEESTLERVKKLEKQMEDLQNTLNSKDRCVKSEDKILRQSLGIYRQLAAERRM